MTIIGRRMVPAEVVGIVSSQSSAASERAYHSFDLSYQTTRDSVRVQASTTYLFWPLGVIPSPCQPLIASLIRPYTHPEHLSSLQENTFTFCQQSKQELGSLHLSISHIVTNHGWASTVLKHILGLLRGRQSGLFFGFWSIFCYGVRRLIEEKERKKERNYQT